MKTPNTMDHIFRERLEDYASDVPVGLWEAIDQKRTRKKRGLLWLQRKGMWLGLLLLLGVFGVGYSVLGEQELDEKMMSIKQENLVKSESEMVKKIDEANEKTALETSPSPSSKNKNNTVLIAENTATNLLEKSNNASQFTQPPFEKSAIISKENKNAIKNTVSNTNLNTNEDLEKVFTDNPISKVTEFANADFPKPITEKADENNTLQALELLLLSELVIKGKPDPCYAFNPYDNGKKGPPHFYVDVLASPDYTNRTLAAKNADLGNGYAALRDSTETSRLGYSSTVRLSLVLANGLALRSGVAYAQINEKLDLFNGTHTKIESYEVKDVYGNVVGIQLDTIVGQLIKTTYNRFHLMDVPVILGYEVRDRNWTFSLNGGAYFNLLFQQKGEFLSPNLTPVTFTSTAEPHYEAYKKTVGMSLFGSVGVNYKIGNRLHLMAEPHFRYYMDSFTKVGYPLQQKYWAVGFNLGVRVQLF